MAIYPNPPLRERLNVFFGEFFRAMRKAEPQAYGAFLERAEGEFQRHGYREETSDGVENILIVRFDSIGDLILTSGFLREVRANFPQARITLVVLPRVYPVVEFCPYVNEVLAFPANPYKLNFPDLLETVAVFCKDNLWQKKFSIAFSPRWHFDTLSSLILCWLSGARERIGYGTFPAGGWIDSPSPPIDNFLLTKNIVTPRNIIADADKNFYLLSASGFKVNQRNIELFYSVEDFQCAKEILEDIPPNCKKVILGLGAQELNRKYPVEKYLIALREIAKKDLVFIIVGGQGELDDANFIERNLPRGKVLNLVGKTTLRQCEAVTAQADFYLGNDTGNMHMAAAEKIPVLCLYHEAVDRENFFPAIHSEFRRFPPYRTKAIVLRPAYQLDDCATLPPCYGHCHHHEPHCITQITPQEIIDGFEKLQTL